MLTFAENSFSHASQHAQPYSVIEYSPPPSDSKMPFSASESAIPRIVSGGCSLRMRLLKSTWTHSSTTSKLRVRPSLRARTLSTISSPRFRSVPCQSGFPGPLSSFLILYISSLLYIRRLHMQLDMQLHGLRYS